ncbi:MAG: TIGR01777 family protein [Flavobacteriales bacterium]|nr:TIGR01777 family oxidoreductase [Bacteroidota bacterium]MCB9240433.1 TIGR01777 family protein [Flavobacteriales bacterium]
MKTIVIAGGSGFLGQSLGRFAQSSGFEVYILSRTQPQNSFDGWIQWDAQTMGPWVNSLSRADVLVNLVGRSVDCVKTPENIDLIWRSRIESTQLLGKAMAQLENRPSVWIQMSTAHIYGDSPTAWCDEYSITGYGLAPDVGRAWEEAHLTHLPVGMRSVILRAGFVLGKDGGAYTRMKQVIRLGLGGRIGSGKQGMSWIHELDINRMIVHMIEDQQMQGVYVVSSPNPLDKDTFMRQLRKSMHMPIALPAPEWLTRLGARLVFKTDPELALYGRYVRSIRLEKEGFEFTYAHLVDAVHALRNG